MGEDLKKDKKSKLQKLKNNKKLKIGMAISALVVVIAIGGGTAYVKSTVSKYENAIYPGMRIQGIDLSGKTKEEAVKIIDQNYKANMEQKKIVVKAGGKNYDINYKDLSLKFDYEKTVDDVLKEGKNNSTFEKFKMIKNGEVKDHEIKFTYDVKPIDEKINAIANELNKPKTEATISGYGGNFNITPEQVGSKLDTENLKAEITNKMTKSSASEKEVVVEGKMVEDKPTITKDELAKIDTLISTYSTNYSTSNYNKSVNIELGASTVNGTLLMPGEKFSFNTIVGDTTPDKGYMSGIEIVGDKLETGYGGGICQVSTTLHNAVLRMGILPDSRYNHNLKVDYVPLGLDATISYGGVDYIFTNSTKYPIYIEGVAGGGTVTFNMYSNSAVKTSKRYEFTSEEYETIPTTTEYKDDATLAAGKEEEMQAGAIGHKARVYRLTYENETLINTELIYNDTYQPLPKIIRRGTGKAETKKEETKKDEPKKDEPKKEESKPQDSKPDDSKPEESKPNESKPN